MFIVDHLARAYELSVELCDITSRIVLSASEWQPHLCQLVLVGASWWISLPITATMSALHVETSCSTLVSVLMTDQSTSARKNHVCSGKRRNFVGAQKQNTQLTTLILITKELQKWSSNHRHTFSTHQHIATHNLQWQEILISIFKKAVPVKTHRHHQCRSVRCFQHHEKLQLFPTRSWHRNRRTFATNHLPCPTQAKLSTPKFNQCFVVILWTCISMKLERETTETICVLLLMIKCVIGECSLPT